MPVQEQILIERPFSRLLRFQMGRTSERPRVLLVAPISGMRSMILRDMILAMLPGHEVHCLIWRNAAEVPVECGPFGLDDNIADVVETLGCLGEGNHVIGLCQSALPVLVAAAILAGTPTQPIFSDTPRKISRSPRLRAPFRQSGKEVKDEF